MGGGGVAILVPCKFRYTATLQIIPDDLLNVPEGTKFKAMQPLHEAPLWGWYMYAGKQTYKVLVYM